MCLISMFTLWILIFIILFNLSVLKVVLETLSIFKENYPIKRKRIFDVPCVSTVFFPTARLKGPLMTGKLKLSVVRRQKVGQLS